MRRLQDKQVVNDAKGNSSKEEGLKGESNNSIPSTADEPEASLKAKLAQDKSLEAHMITFADIKAHEQRKNQVANNNNNISPPPPSAASWYDEGHATSLVLILVLHLVFFRQWNRRKTKKDVLVSYRILVQKKHWHRFVVAVLSHPPTDLATTSSSTSTSNTAAASSLAISHGNEEHSNNDNNNRHGGRARQWLYWLYSKLMFYLHPLLHGHLNGLPLLVYNSHLFWTCRALEATFDSSWHYARVLLVITLVSMALELRMSHNMLKLNRTIVGLGVSVTQRAILHRSIGTTTMTTSALIMMYRMKFAFVPLRVLPFMGGTGIASHGMEPSITHWMCIGMLIALSWTTRPVLSSICCGTLSGLLWTAGLTRFLADVYWGTCLCVLVLTACALSIHASSNSNNNRMARPSIPCVDYVSWDRRGRIIQQEQQGNEGSSDNDEMEATSLEESDHDEEEEEEEEEDPYSGQLFDPEQPSSSDGGRQSLWRRNPSRGGGSHDEIHGRVPLMDMDSAGEISMDDVPLLGSSSTTTTPRLSRRGRGYHDQ